MTAMTLFHAEKCCYLVNARAHYLPAAC